MAVPQPRTSDLQSIIIEPLSERELEVLRLLVTELSGPEIARELIVSPEHLAHPHQKYFHKLGVNNRRRLSAEQKNSICSKSKIERPALTGVSNRLSGLFIFLTSSR